MAYVLLGIRYPLPMRILQSLTLLILCGPALFSAEAKRRPDVLLILLDDSGWTDFGCYGSRIQTPHIDRLASQGMRFTDCHSAAPNCSPSRTGLLTGRTPSRVGVYSYLPSNHVMHLRGQEITVAELLKSAGYRTGHFGKWHLSRLQHPQPQPADQGFDHSLGTDNNAAPSHLDPVNFIRNGKAVGKMEGYSCQLVVDETLKWLENVKRDDKQTPTLSCVWFHEPHTPIASPPDLVAKYQQQFPQLSKKQATYYANIENVDRAVGRLMQWLDQKGLTDDTFVFLTSDNGPLGDDSKVGLRGKKSHVWEGGHRVPGIFRWPDQIEAGSVCHVPISGVDFLPTVCELAGSNLPTDRVIDGTSIIPLLEGRETDFKRGNPLYWFFYRLNPSIAMRDGKWVLIAETNDANRPKSHPFIREDMLPIKQSVPERFELYDLNVDLGQREDLSESHPKVLNRLKGILLDFHREVVAEGPHWQIPADYQTNTKKRVWTSK